MEIVIVTGLALLFLIYLEVKIRQRELDTQELEGSDHEHD